MSPARAVIHFHTREGAPVTRARAQQRIPPAPVLSDPAAPAAGSAVQHATAAEPLAVPVSAAKASAGPVPAALTDATMYRCLAEATDVAASSKKIYASAIRSMLARATAVTTGAENPLLAFILNVEASKQAVLAMDVSLRTRQHYVKAVLSIYKHAACASEPCLQAVRPAWDAFSAELSVQVEALVKASRKSTKEAAAWTSLEEWIRMEAQLAQHEYGSAKHLLVAFHCRWPPLRGGDLGRLYIVPPADARATDGHNNVLMWAGQHQPAEARIQQHKTAHIKGTLVRPLPASLKKLVAASLEQQPRLALFVSPQTGLPFETEAVYTSWANRVLKAVFGKPVTCNTARHAYCSALDTARMSTAQLEEIARLMGHGLAQQRAYHRVDDAAVAESVTNADGEYTVPIRPSGP